MAETKVETTPHCWVAIHRWPLPAREGWKDLVARVLNDVRPHAPPATDMKLVETLAGAIWRAHLEVVAYMPRKPWPRIRVTPRYQQRVDAAVEAFWVRLAQVLPIADPFEADVTFATTCEGVARESGDEGATG